MKKNLRYNIMLRAEPEGGFTVIVPALPGCITYGKNLQEAEAMAEDAIKAYLHSYKKHQETIPVDDNCYMTSLEVSYA